MIQKVISGAHQGCGSFKIFTCLINNFGNLLAYTPPPPPPPPPKKSNNEKRPKKPKKQKHRHITTFSCFLPFQWIGKAVFSQWAVKTEQKFGTKCIPLSWKLDIISVAVKILSLAQKLRASWVLVANQDLSSLWTSMRIYLRIPADAD